MKLNEMTAAGYHRATLLKVVKDLRDDTRALRKLEGERRRARDYTGALDAESCAETTEFWADELWNWAKAE